MGLAIPAGNATQAQLDSASIPAMIMNAPTGRLINFIMDPTPDQLAQAQALAILPGTPGPPPPTYLQLQASDEWIETAARLAAIPGPPQGGGPDNYAVIRTRYTQAVADALAKANAQGGLA